MEYKLFLFLSIIALVRAYGVENVINFVTDAGASTSAADNSGAFANAVAQASSTGYPVYIPPGTYKFTRSISSKDVIVRGAGETRSVFTFATLAGGSVAWEVSGSNAIVEHIGLNTIYGRPNVGVPPCQYSGIRLADSCDLYHVTIQGFYSGLIWNSGSGHTISEHLHTTNNYYGLYVQNSGGDNYIGLSGLEGNTMASIGIPSEGSMGSGDMIFRTHMGFGPYGVYQEGPSKGGYNNFIADAHFQLARFESIGNGAVFTENAGTSAYGGIRDNEFYNVGFSWNNQYRISSRAADYAFVVGTVQAPCYYFPGGSGFGPGAKGTFNLNQAEGWGDMKEYATTVCCTN